VFKYDAPFDDIGAQCTNTYYFNSAISDGLLSHRCQSCTANGIDNGSRCAIAVNRTRVIRIRGSARPRSGQVQSVAVQELRFSDIRVIDGQCWDNVQSFRINVCVSWIACSPLEGPGADYYQLPRPVIAPLQ
jgi:hypothetical protein